MSKPATLIVAVAAVILAVVLNPSADRHRDKIKEAIAERSQLEKLLGIGHLTSFASRYHSLGVASYTTVNDKLTSVGAFGIVFVPD
jgi:heme O synthase-like polyprenyltransferase